MKLLTTTLRVNATTTLMFTLLIAYFAEPIANMLGQISVWWMYGLAAVLLDFAVLCWWFARKQWFKWALFIVVSDSLWVIGSIIVMFAAVEFIAPVMLVMMAAVAILVAVYAALQMVGIYQAKQTHCPL